MTVFWGVRIGGGFGYMNKFTNTFITSSCPISLLFLVVLTSISLRVASVPTAEFRPAAGEKEVATLTGRSLYWPYDHTGKRSREVQPIQLCGYRLLEAVRGLCRGNYVGFNRRSDPDMTDDRLKVMRMQESKEQLGEPSRHKVLPSRSNEMGERHLRFRRNIIDECCKKPCSVNEMLRYCGR